MSKKTNQGTSNAMTRKLLTTFSVITFAAIVKTASPAYAGSTYFLQLGSFYTRSDAEQKWQDLQTKNPEIFSGLGLHIAEVSIPPDNNISYRTQAGPVSSRSKAENLCNTIQEKAGECYVVETAVMTSDPNTNTPAATPKKREVVEGFSEVKPSSAKNPDNSFIAGREPRFLDDEPVEISPKPKPEIIATAAAPEVAPAPEPPVKQPVKKPKIAVKPVKPAESVENDAELSPAAARNSYHRTSKNTQDIKVAGREPKFLDEDENPAPATINTVPPVTAAPAPAWEQKIAQQETPPPQEEQKPGFFARLFGSSSSQEKPKEKPQPVPVENSQAMVATAGNTVGDVRVAEAIRVPLSQENDAGRTIVQNNGMNSNSLFDAPPAATEKGIYWAQINYFPDEEHAQGFYEEFREHYPDISEGLRIRVTRPYNSSNRRVSLRVGAFASANDIKSICRIAQERGLHCTMVKDMGSMSAGGIPAMGNNSSLGMASFSAAQNTEMVEYWVQLGSFASPDEAWDKWSTMRKNHRKLLSKASADVNTPESSSAENVIYRLRTGPFSSRKNADSLCAKLSKSGENCIVVNEH